MKKIKEIGTNLLWVIFLSVLIISCSGQSDKEINKDIVDSTKSVINAEKENPFVQREFSTEINNKWIGNGAAYGFYRKGQAPGKKGPSQEEIIEDLEIISKKWNLIRVYNADIDTKFVLEAIKMNNYPIKVMLGIWLENEKDNPEKHKSNMKNILAGIEFAKNYRDNIVAVCVGNETQVEWAAHRMDLNRFIEYVRFVRQNTDLPVTSADDYMYWVKDSSRIVSDELDFVTTHIHPSWNGISLEKSIFWIDSIYSRIQIIHPEKMIVIGETGWPTKYDNEKTGPGEQGSLIKGKVNIAAQKYFFKMYNKWLNENKVKSFIFEVFDEPWKGGGEFSRDNDVEKNWGVYYENRTPKWN